MGNIVCLFDYTGNMGRPWAHAGHTVHCYDLQHHGTKTELVGDRGGSIVFHECDIMKDGLLFELQALNPIFCAAFPPCTDLAVSGSRWFASKACADPRYRTKAMNMVYRSRDLFEALGAPWLIENPVSVISSEWRKPDYTFNPCDYGGWLPENDVHPQFPSIIPPRDAYTKRTCLWTGSGFVMPQRRPVPIDTAQASVMHRKLGSKSTRTKNIRSATPRGFADAIMRANYNKAVTYRMRM